MSVVEVGYNFTERSTFAALDHQRILPIGRLYLPRVLLFPALQNF